MEEKDIGGLLRSAREAAGVSQRKLAKRAGVAHATISQIESNGFNPTVGMLKKILDGIPLSLSQFFSETDLNADPAIFFRSTELKDLSEGGVSYRQVGRNLRGHTIQMLCERYAPGATTGRHELQHEGEECGVILKGRLTVKVGNNSQVLGPGDAYYFQSKLPHSFSNDHDEPCELISACSPPSF